MPRRKMTADEKARNKEIQRLEAIFKEIDEPKSELSESLIKRAAFMRITLEKYEEDIEKNGYVEMFTQSPNTPPYERVRPVSQLYTSLNKNYQSIMKQLFDILPKDTDKDPDDGFDDFVYGREDT